MTQENSSPSSSPSILAAQPVVAPAGQPATPAAAPSTPAAAPSTPSGNAAAPAAAARPEWLQEQFWDATKGEIRTETLAQSYNELRKTLSSKPRLDVPDKYNVQVPDGLELSDDLYARFKEKKFSNDHVQEVLNLAKELFIEPMRQERVELEKQKIAVAKGFNNPDDLNEFLGKVKAYAVNKWGEEEALRRAMDHKGVLEIATLMDAEMGNATIPNSGGSGTGDSEEALMKILSDPNYRTDAALQRKAQAMADRLGVPSYASSN